MKLPDYLEIIKEGLIKTQPYGVVLRKVNFLPNNLIYGIDYTQSDNMIYTQQKWSNPNPNYLSGYYLLSNIPPNNIEIVEKEC